MTYNYDSYSGGVLYNETVLGTCSICGGPVVVPTVYHSVNRPIPKCKHCGAIEKQNFGPIIPMIPPKPQPKFDFPQYHEPQFDMVEKWSEPFW